MSFPPVVLSLILMVGLGTGLGKVVLAIVLVDWTRFCRVLRAEVLVTARRDYVAAARLLGFSHARTLAREVVPATLPLLLTLLSLEMGIAVVIEAMLSFVGLGVGARTPAWGQMIADARRTSPRRRWTCSCRWRRSSSPSPASTCSATVCAVRSTCGSRAARAA